MCDTPTLSATFLRDLFFLLIARFLTLATVWLDVDGRPLPPRCLAHEPVDWNFFFWYRMNLFKIFRLTPCSIGTCTPVLTQVLMSSVLAFGNFWRYTSIWVLRLLFRKGSIFGVYILSITIYTIHYFADFPPKFCRFLKKYWRFFHWPHLYCYTLYILLTDFVDSFFSIILGQSCFLLRWHIHQKCSTFKLANNLFKWNMLLILCAFWGKVQDLRTMLHGDIKF